MLKGFSSLVPRLRQSTQSIVLPAFGTGVSSFSTVRDYLSSEYLMEAIERDLEKVSDLSKESKVCLNKPIENALIRDQRLSVEEPYGTWFNQRLDRVRDNNVWPYMAEEELSTHAAEYRRFWRSGEGDVRWRSRYGKFDLIDNLWFLVNGPYKQEVYVSDWLMFNKNFKIMPHQVDACLNLCRFRWIDDSDRSMQVDGWYDCEESIYATPNYKITYDDSNFFEMDFVANPKERQRTARALLTIMNESPPDFVNWHNYQMISEWEVDNDRYSKSWVSLNRMVKQHREVMDETHKKISENESFLKPEDLIIPIRQRYAPKQILQHVFRFLETYDEEITKFSKFSAPLLITGFIEEHQGQKVLIDPTSNSLDLSQFREEHGDYLTNILIKQLEYEMKNLHYCSGVTKAALFAEMYNTQERFGMGVFGHDDETTMTEEQAAQVLKDHNDYIGYYKGTAIKTDFRDFPLMNFERYNSYNGKDAFQIALQNVLEKKKTKKVPTTVGRAFSELERMFEPVHA